MWPFKSKTTTSPCGRCGSWLHGKCLASSPAVRGHRSKAHTRYDTPGSLMENEEYQLLAGSRPGKYSVSCKRHRIGLIPVDRIGDEVICCPGYECEGDGHHIIRDLKLEGHIDWLET